MQSGVIKYTRITSGALIRHLDIITSSAVPVYNSGQPLVYCTEGYQESNFGYPALKAKVWRNKKKTKAGRGKPDSGGR